MMRKLSVKKSLFTIVVAMALILSLVLVACGGGGNLINPDGGGDKSVYNLTLDKTVVSLDKGDSIEVGYTFTKDGEQVDDAELEVTVGNDNVTYDAQTNKITAVKVGNAIVTVKIKGISSVSATMTVTVPEYTVFIDGDDVQTVDLGAEENIEFSVRKDGLKVSDKRVKITVVEGADLVTYTAIGNRIKFDKEGTAKIRIELESDPSVYAEKTYNIVKSFWSSQYAVNKQLMTITDASVAFPGGGGNQYFLGVLEGGTKYVFKADITLPSSLPSYQSVGLGHTIDENNSSLWFGVQGEDTGSNYRLYIRNFYNTWLNGRDTRYDNYTDIDFGSKTITCITVRDGQNYWYSIGGLVGTYTADGATDVPADRDTWVGIYSQERELTVTNFSYSTEDADIAEAKTLCEDECAIFAIENKTMSSVVKGSTVTYTASKVSAPGKDPAIVWTLDKTGMTAGADTTTMTDGVLSVDPGAAGVVIVKAQCGGKSDSVEVNILQESLADENETVTVDGGVILAEDGTVEFPESANGANPTLGEQAYVDLFYAAKLKQTVKGDFSLSFKVTDLKTVAGSSYMVSIGDRLGNLFFTPTGVSLVASYMTKTDVVNERKVNNDQTVTATFAAAEEYAVTVAVVNGFWKVTVNEQELVFQGNVLRRIEDYTAARKILIATKAGTSMKVSDIQVTDGADSKYIVLNANTEAVTDEGEIIGFESIMAPSVDGKWIGKDYFVTTTYYGELLPAGDYTVSMNVKYNSAMSDSKLGIAIGNWEYHVNNKILASSCIQGELYNNGWNGNSANSSVTSADGAFNVTIKRISGTVYFYIDGTLIKSLENSPADRIMKFWTLADDGSVNGGKVKVTDISVREGAVLISIDGATAVQAGTATAPYTVSVVGSEETPVWTMDDSTLTAGAATFDPTAHTLTFDDEAQGYVTIKVTVMGFDAFIKVTATLQPADQNTAIAESKGGVKQDVVNKKIVFDDAAAEGVADEHRYSEASPYYAILNTAANTRAVIRDNFVLEFTVSDYVSTAQFPKLMISLGAKYEQFYVVYKDGNIQIQTFTHPHDGSNSTNYDGGWINSAQIAADFTTSHTFTIKCEDGLYTVTMDNTAITGWNENGNSRMLIRSTESIATASNIMFSTNGGTVATVTDIKLSAVAGKEGKVTTTYNNNIAVNEETGDVTFTVTERGIGGNGYVYVDNIYTYGAVGANCEITFDVQFNSAMTDGKLCVKLDSDRAISVISAGDNIKGEYIWAWGGSAEHKDNFLVDGKVKVKIVITNNVAKGYLMKKTGETWDYTYLVSGAQNEVAAGGVISFCVLGETDPNKGSDVGKTITVSNITVTPTTAA